MTLTIFALVLLGAIAFVILAGWIIALCSE